jgi:hypothetical protein
MILMYYNADKSDQLLSDYIFTSLYHNILEEVCLGM